MGIAGGKYFGFAHKIRISYEQSLCSRILGNPANSPGK